MRRIPHRAVRLKGAGGAPAEERHHLAVFGGDQVRFALDVEEEAPTLLSFDFVNMDGPVSQELKARVSQEGVVLYEEIR